MSLSSLNSIGQGIFELESGNENVDRQTDVGHINLIDGLVTRNPPRNFNKSSENSKCSALVECEDVIIRISNE